MLKYLLGKRIRQMRHSKGLTQKALAGMIGVDYSYIGKMERAEQLPSINILIKLSEALSVNCSHFFIDDPTFRLISLLPKEALVSAEREELWNFLKELEGINVEDITLLIEIVKILKKHAKVKEDKKKELSAVAESQTAFDK